MRRCLRCGEMMDDNVRFCPRCGEKVPEIINERRTEYAGTVLKCPHCGAEVESYTAHCPACGRELGSSSNRVAVDELRKEIATYDKLIETNDSGYSTWSTSKKVGWWVLNIFFMGIPAIIYLVKHNGSEKVRYEHQKQNYIDTFTVPNDRKNILDCLVFVKDRLYTLSKLKMTSDNYKMANVWKVKAGHLFQQAELLFPGDSIANKTYGEINNFYKNCKTARTKRIIIIAAIIVAVIMLSYVFGEKQPNTTETTKITETTK